MKRWGIITTLLAVLLVAAAFRLAEKQGWLSLGAEAESMDGVIQEIALRDSGQKLWVKQDQLYKGDLLLVNSEHKVGAEGTQPDITELAGKPELLGRAALLDHKIELSRRVALKFAAMLDAAAEDGVTHFMISSGYRSEAKQSELYAQKGGDYALPPGYSEHHLGLSLDVGSTEGTMAKAEEGKWLEKNAARYGFVLRYPADKTQITGIAFEPWHFRYVGLPHSVIMQRNHLVLEEYLDLLKEKKTLSTKVDGESYEVCYYSPDEIAQLRVPKNRDYALSGDNRGGLILTVYP
ncbi:hypothetical protein B9G55_08020 [Saccharibacillus sp. O16]|nr:hypothetical protein B9G55_08020 [Saccharibacillus sp. O16]